MERLVARVTRTLIKRLPSAVRRGICGGVYARIGNSDDWIYERICKERKHLWIAAAPKSGSTWVSTVLEEALGYRKIALTRSFERLEQQVDSRLLLIPGAGENLFSPHQHCRYSDFVGDLIARGNVRVLITARNIFDTLMSLHDHNERENHLFSMYYADARLWSSLKTKENRLRFLADTAIPWYANFYAGWLSNLSRHPDRISICRYENLVEDPSPYLLEHLQAIGIPTSKEAISRGLLAAENGFTRKNKGIVGRGQEIPADLRDQIVRVFRYYADIDWSMIGIPGLKKSQAA